MTTVPLGCFHELGITGDVDRGGVGVHDQAVRGLTRDVAADTEERVLYRDRVARVAGGRAGRADGQQGVRVGRAGVEQSCYKAYLMA